ncbi:hypothetical protein B0H14DRAFT_3505822 [Mycena olivaceomarginata]|nr:hypothetical protein B0H14DRAFT_3505822 [Mycena olivaceomarginata]
MAAIDQSSYAVAFPTTDKNYQPAPRPRPPHLPFRRISLPTNPRHRESVVSVASFDSLAEEGDSPVTPSLPAVMRNLNSPNNNNQRRSKVRPTSSRRATKQPDAREAKRRKVIQEFYETEKAYVDGLELIYSHFLTPIIASLETPQPLLQRSDLASVFSNFVDIWNLHRAFYASLSDLLSSSPPDAAPPPLSPVLLSHFPYLSLYNPFVTAFPSTISAMANLTAPPSAYHPAAHPQYSPAFAAYLRAQEADPRCGKLKLRDWLLTIVQRCPRYLLLLKDLIGCTEPDDPEHAQLVAVHALVSKITLTLNTSIHTHAQTLALLALQRATPSLPADFPLIAPGRALVRRGPLAHVERGKAAPREREFLLFSDCLVWLEAEDGGGVGGWGGAGEAAPEGPVRPLMARSRSKSEAELPLLRGAGEGGTASPAPAPSPAPSPRKSAYHHPVSRMKRRHASTGAGDEGRWAYKGRAALVDLDVVVSAPPRERGEERRLEVLSPEGSFVLYADSEEERDAWTAAIRQTKAALFVALNATHPDSTLTSSASTAHLRRSLQALPFPPADERGLNPHQGKPPKGKDRTRTRTGGGSAAGGWSTGCPRYGSRTRRRRGACGADGRLGGAGGGTTAGCAGGTFFIADPNAPQGAGASKPARACNACYETVFPLLDSPAADDDDAGDDDDARGHAHELALALPLVALDAVPPARQRQAAKFERLLRRGGGGDAHAHVYAGSAEWDGEGGEVEMGPRERVRMVRSPPPRPRSYVQILEDFEENNSARFAATVVDLNDRDRDAEEGEGELLSFVPPRRREDTARRNKRFSLPAVALQTTSVTARTQAPAQEGHGQGQGRAPRAKRFSLVLGTRHHQHQPSRTQSEMVAGRGRIEEEDAAAAAQEGAPELGKGVAAGRLSELLGRQRPQRAEKMILDSRAVGAKVSHLADRNTRFLSPPLPSSGLYTFLQTTLLSILTSTMRLFVRSRPRHASSVTPYPIAPHLENCILDISRDASAHYAGGRKADLERGVLAGPKVARQAIRSDVLGQSGAIFSKPLEAASKRNALPTAPHPVFSSVVKSSPSAKRDPIPPLSVATNSARIPGHPRKTIPQDENTNPSAAQPTRRHRSPTKSRYLSFIRSSPTKSLGAKTSPDKTRISRRTTDRDAPCQLFSSPGDGAIAPLKLESGVSDEPIDWAARIRSVFYKNREGDEDLSESVRNLFNRDSGSSIGLDHSMDIIKDGDLLDERRGWSSRQASSSDADSFSGPSSLSPFPCSRSSELPYLGDRPTHPGISASSSSSSGAFNDLLASVERKYPGQRWKDIVEFSAEERCKGLHPYSGIDDEEKQQWSDVFCIDDYAH